MPRRLHLRMVRKPFGILVALTGLLDAAMCEKIVAILKYVDEIIDEIY